MVQSGYPCGPNWMWDASLSGPCDGGGGGGGGQGGGGGGGWWCGGNYFDPSPDPVCYAPIAVPPPEPPSAKPIECMATLFDRPVDDPARNLLVLLIRTGNPDLDPNSGAKLVDKVISGGPNNVVDPSTGKTTTYLDVWVHSSYSGVDQPSGGSWWYTTGMNPSNCDGVEAMLLGRKAGKTTQLSTVGNLHQTATRSATER